MRVKKNKKNGNVLIMKVVRESKAISLNLKKAFSNLQKLLKARLVSSVVAKA